MITRKPHPAIAVIANPAREKPLSFKKLSERCGASTTTIWRWTTRGSLGVVLETMQFGDRRCTSEEAWTRFCRRQQEAAARRYAPDEPSPAPQPLSEASRKKLAAVGL
jgi:hypothetical protein